MSRSEGTTAVGAGYRPAFYALGGGAWRDYVTLLHPPYTAWHLSYVVLGVALAPAVHIDRLVASLVAFFMAMGLSAHALDELSGRPLNTRISSCTLWTIAVGGLGGAVALGIAGSIVVTPWLLVFVAFGLFIAPAYNLEWFGGRFHSDAWFAFAWGSFPFLTAYWVSSQRLAPPVLLGAIAAFTLSFAQRILSSRVRMLRRKTRGLQGRVAYADGSVEDIDRAWVMRPIERALMLLSLTIATVSTAMLLARL